MLSDWKKKLSLLLIIITGQGFALPDIPSLIDCPDIIYNSGFQNDSKPSNGVGGAFPGVQTRFVNSNGANRKYYVYIPSNYNSANALPLLFAWHGASGPTFSDSNAFNLRSFWQEQAESSNLILVTQIATGSNGGGFVFPNDILILRDIITDMQSDYNIENSRIYGHGFSSGGHVMHTMMLYYNQNYAAYAVSAGNFADALNESINVPQNRPVVPVFVSVGSADPMLPRIQTERIKFLNAGWQENKTYWLDVFNGGHIIDPLAPKKIWDKLCIQSNLN